MKNPITIKHDTPENWARAINFIPKDGEIIIYDYLTEETPFHRFKMGDGKTKVNDLNFLELTKSKVSFYDGTLIL